METPNELKEMLAEGFKLLPMKVTYSWNEETKTKDYNKQPATGSWEDASNDLGVVLGWLKDYPGCGWAIETGHEAGILVVDLDNKNGKDGVGEWAKLTKEYGDHPETVTTETISGGKHLAFKLNGTPLPSKKDFLAEGIDIQSDRSLIMVAPTEGYKRTEPLKKSRLPVCQNR